MKHFKIIAKDGKARAGVLKTAHGEVKTPIFMPVGTQASVKALAFDDLKDVKAQIILGNTYHLNLRPGSKLIKKMGGLHKFMHWDGPILTDSGGFQAFSLGAMIEHGARKVGSGSSGRRLEVGGKKSSKIYVEKDKSVVRKVELLSKMTEKGVLFTSHLDGSKHLLTPEKSAQVQLELGSDIVLVLDELLSHGHNKTYVKKSLERTHRWEKRSQEYFHKHLAKSINPGAMLFGIVQGVYDQKIREGEAKWVAEQGFEGISIGGSCGTSKFWPGPKSKEMDPEWVDTRAVYETMGWVVPFLPEDTPKHALGIGEVVDFFECIERGIDMFDCVAPTRRARNGSLYISPKNGGSLKNESRRIASSSGPYGTPQNKFVMSLQKAEFIDDKKPIDPGCECFTCQNFSRSYLRHLYQCQEIVYHRLASIHNVYFMLHLVEQIREAIINKQFKKLKAKWLK